MSAQLRSGIAASGLYRIRDSATAEGRLSINPNSVDVARVLSYKWDMEQRILGRSGPSVSALGLGCMSIGIADVYTSSVRDDAAAGTRYDAAMLALIDQ